MKRLLFLLFVLMSTSIFAQTYYNSNNELITKYEFDSLKLFKYHMVVKNDSLSTFKLIDICNRSEVGSLGDSKNLLRELNQNLNLNLNDSKPLIIYYYPGNNECNQSAISTRKSQLKWDRKLQKKIDKISEVNVLRIYKNKEGIKTLGDYNWKKDPNALIENLFFNYHYNCGSFVVILKDKYAAFFGEYSHNDVLFNLVYLLKQNKTTL